MEVEMRIALTLVTTVAGLGSAMGEEPVHFADEKLKAAVEAQLWVEDPTPTDMLALTSLQATSRGITSMTGLEYATNLQELVLNNNEISDISVVSGLTNLDHLDVHNNLVTDISAVSGLANLRTLILRINQISDISAVSGLNKLETLILRNNQITDISALSALTEMRYLQLADNQISDISALAGLVHLETLVLEDNQISDISALASLTHLDRLDLRNNQLNDEACDVYIPQIRANNPYAYFKHDPCVEYYLVLSSTAGGSIVDPGEGQFISGDGELVHVKAEADAGYVFLCFSGTYFTTQNPTSVSMSQDHEIQAHFIRALKVVHVDDDAPGDPGAKDSTVSDPHENGTVEHPFDKIQEGINVAADGASVVVREGTYHENIDFLGKCIGLLGMASDDPNGTAYPVLDGAGSGPVVQFTRDEDPNCVLSGFIITHGSGRNAGAILCSDASPTVANCLIVGNRATDPGGAAVYCANSKAVLVNCTITDNHGGEQGAGVVLADSEVVLLDSIVWGNAPQQVLLQGGVVPRIRHSDIDGGWLGLLTIIDADPLFARRGYWADPSDLSIATEPGDLRTIWIDGDYHLRSQAGRWDPKASAWVRDEATSPCIDAGSRTSPVADEPLPNGGIVNMGAYGGTAQASKSPSR